MFSKADLKPYLLSKGLHTNLLKFDVASLIPDGFIFFNACPSTWVAPKEVLQVPTNVLTSPNGDVYHFRKQDTSIFPGFVKSLQQEQQKLRGVSTEEKWKMYLQFKENKHKTLCQTWTSLRKMYANNCPSYPELCRATAFTFRLQLIEKFTTMKEDSLFQDMELRLVSDTKDIDSFYISEPVITNPKTDQDVIFYLGQELEKFFGMQYPSFQIEFTGLCSIFKLNNYSYGEEIANFGETKILNDGTFLMHKGVILSRRDVCPWVKTGYQRVLKLALNGATREQLNRAVAEYVCTLSDNLRVSELSFTRQGQTVIMALESTNHFSPVSTNNSLKLNKNQYIIQLMKAVKSILDLVNE